MLVAKIYENYRSDIIINQFFIKWTVSITEDLADFDVAEFSSTDILLAKYMKVEIYETWNPEILKFKWFIENVSNSVSVLNEISKVTCWGAKWLLQKRGALYWYDEISTPLNIVVSKMLDLWNDEWDNWEYWIDYTDPIDMEYWIWNSIYSLIQELADQVWWFWTVKNNKVIISPLIWEDKTSWGWSVTLFFDKSNNSNIKNILTNTEEDRYNIVVGIDDSWAKLLRKNPRTYSYWMIVETFKTWDIINKTEQLLADSDVETTTINVTLDESANINVNIWDKINVNISWSKLISDINTEMFVLKKLSTYEFGKRYEIISVWEKILKTNTLSWLIKDLWVKINKLRTKN